LKLYISTVSTYIKREEFVLPAKVLWDLAQAVVSDDDELAEIDATEKKAAQLHQRAEKRRMEPRVSDDDDGAETEVTLHRERAKKQRMQAGT
jgi:hypothetical protein